MIDILLVIQVIVCIFLISVILLQKSQSDSLSGLGSSNNMNFVSSQFKANALTKITSIAATIFIINCIALANLMSKQSESRKVNTLIEQIDNQEKIKESNDSIIIPEVE